MLKRAFISIFSAVILPILVPAIAYAHVVVQPDQVGIGKFQIFSVSVPAEKAVATTGVRLLLPVGLREVTPTVKAGWQITTKTSGSGDSASTTEIDWSGGALPAGFRDDFTFSAQVPAQATTLDWKAYQTYADGSVVSWDQTPTNSDDATGNKGPYSTTKIVNDLTARNVASTGQNQAGPYIIAILALLIPAISFIRKQARK